MRAEGKLGIERHPKNLGRLDKGQEGAAEKDLGMVRMLVGVRGDKGDA